MASSSRPPPPPPPPPSISGSEGKTSSITKLFSDPNSNGHRASVKLPGLSKASDDCNIAGKAKIYHDLSNAVKDVGTGNGNTENLLNNFLNDIVMYRWIMKQPYSYIGSKHLMLINPLQEDNIDCSCNMHSYLNGDISFLMSNPHPYGYLESILRSNECIVGGLSKSTFLICGEKSSGKTYVMNQLLSYYVERKRSSSSIQLINRLLQASSYIFNSLGHAMTLSNYNSTLFSKNITFHNTLHTVKGQSQSEIIGLTFNTLFLDTRRVTSYSQGERTYNIFYQLLACCLNGNSGSSLHRRLGTLKLANTNKFRILSHSSVSPENYDAVSFDILTESFLSLNIPENEIFEYYTIIASIFHLSNIEFEVSGDYGVIKAKANTDGYNPLSIVGELLGISDVILTRLLVSKSNIKNGRIINVLNGKMQCSYVRDTVCAYLYEMLFDLITKRLNSLISNNSPSLTIDETVTFLEAIGYENTSMNCLNQFLNNYAHELLLHNNHVTNIEREYVLLKLEEVYGHNDYEQYYNILKKNINVTSNNVALLGDPTYSILSILNTLTTNYTSTNIATVNTSSLDEIFFQQLHGAYSSNNTSFSKVSDAGQHSVFRIAHHGHGETQYNNDNNWFISNEMSALFPLELVVELNKSTIGLVKQISALFREKYGTKNTPYLVTKWISDMMQYERIIIATVPYTYYLYCTNPCSPETLHQQSGLLAMQSNDLGKIHALYDRQHVAKQIQCISLASQCYCYNFQMPIRLTYTQLENKYVELFRIMTPIIEQYDINKKDKDSMKRTIVACIIRAMYSSISNKIIFGKQNTIFFHKDYSTAMKAMNISNNCLSEEFIQRIILQIQTNCDNIDLLGDFIRDSMNVDHTVEMLISFMDQLSAKNDELLHAVLAANKHCNGSIKTLMRSTRKLVNQSDEIAAKVSSTEKSLIEYSKHCTKHLNNWSHLPIPTSLLNLKVFINRLSNNGLDQLKSKLHSMTTSINQFVQVVNGKGYVVQCIAIEHQNFSKLVLPLVNTLHTTLNNIQIIIDMGTKSIFDIKNDIDEGLQVIGKIYSAIFNIQSNLTKLSPYFQANDGSQNNAELLEKEVILMKQLVDETDNNLTKYYTNVKSDTQLMVSNYNIVNTSLMVGNIKECQKYVLKMEALAMDAVRTAKQPPSDVIYTHTVLKQKIESLLAKYNDTVLVNYNLAHSAYTDHELLLEAQGMKEKANALLQDASANMRIGNNNINSINNNFNNTIHNNIQLLGNEYKIANQFMNSSKKQKGVLMGIVEVFNKHNQSVYEKLLMQLKLVNISMEEEYQNYLDAVKSDDRVAEILSLINTAIIRLDRLCTDTDAIFEYAIDRSKQVIKLTTSSEIVNADIIYNRLNIDDPPPPPPHSRNSLARLFKSAPDTTNSTSNLMASRMSLQQDGTIFSLPSLLAASARTISGFLLRHSNKTKNKWYKRWHYFDGLSMFYSIKEYDDTPNVSTSKRILLAANTYAYKVNKSDSWFTLACTSYHNEYIFLAEDAHVADKWIETINGHIHAYYISSLAYNSDYWEEGDVGLKCWLVKSGKKVYIRTLPELDAPYTGNIIIENEAFCTEQIILFDAYMYLRLSDKGGWILSNIDKKTSCVEPITGEIGIIHRQYRACTNLTIYQGPSERTSQSQHHIPKDTVFKATMINKPSLVGKDVIFIRVEDNHSHGSGWVKDDESCEFLSNLQNAIQQHHIL